MSGMTNLVSGTFSDLTSVVNDLCETGAIFWHRGWTLGTSGNFSVVLNRNPVELLTTVRGCDKSRLTMADFVIVNGASGENLGQSTPSSEIVLHTALAEERNLGAVLHTHSVWSTLLSDAYHSSGGFEITGYEMLKGLDGVKSHDASIWIDVLENTPDIRELSEKVRARLRDPSLPMEHGFIVRKHGLYTWGRDLAEARQHVEVLEFLCECLARKLMLVPRV